MSPVITEPSPAFRFLCHLLAYPLHGAQVSELALGFFVGIFGTPPLTNEVVGFGFQVEAQLIFHVGGWVGTEESGVTPPERNRCHPISSGIGSCVTPSTLPTAVA